MPMQKPSSPAPQGRTPLWNHPAFSLLLALLCGFIAWAVVTVFIDPQGVRFVYDVPINYAYSASTYTSQGLDIVEKPETDTVTVKVAGNTTIIGNIENSDIMVYPSYSGVSGAGKVSLRLQARLANTTDFPGDIDCSVVDPQTIDVVFDEVSEKTLPITVDASGVTVADGYMLNRTAAAKELERLISNMQKYLDALNAGDEAGLHALLREGRERKERLDTERKIV